MFAEKARRDNVTRFALSFGSNTYEVFKENSLAFCSKPGSWLSSLILRFG
jgi:hypothetical protein